MAIYHCAIKNIGRSNGKSAVASSAYRSGEKLHDKEQDKTFDYTSKDNVVYSEIFLCENAPTEYRDRETLWNEVQKVEKAKDARFAREWEVAIPNELTLDQAKELTRGFCESLASEGMCIDMSIHWKEGNHHAHIMGTTRPIQKNGKWGQKEKKAYALDEKGEKIPIFDENGIQKVDSRNRKQWKRITVESNDWNKREKVEEWRARWAEHCNQYLEKENQIDHRSYQRQGVEQIPTIHEGYVARQMEQRGQISELCEQNRKIKSLNEKIKEIVQDIKERVNEQIAKFRGLERASDNHRETADRNRFFEVRSRARQQIDTRPNERDNAITRPTQKITEISNRAQQRVRDILIQNQGAERRKRRIDEIKRRVDVVKSLQKLMATKTKYKELNRRNNRVKSLIEQFNTEQGKIEQAKSQKANLSLLAMSERKSCDITIKKSQENIENLFNKFNIKSIEELYKARDMRESMLDKLKNVYENEKATLPAEMQEILGGIEKQVSLEQQKQPKKSLADRIAEAKEKITQQEEVWNISKATEFVEKTHKEQRHVDVGIDLER